MIGSGSHLQLSFSPVSWNSENTQVTPRGAPYPGRRRRLIRAGGVVEFRIGFWRTADDDGRHTPTADSFEGSAVAITAASPPPTQRRQAHKRGSLTTGTLAEN